MISPGERLSASPAGADRCCAEADARRDAISPQHTRTATVFARLLERLPPALAEKYVLPWAGGTPRIDRLCAAVTSATRRPAKRPGHPPGGSHNLATLCREAMRQAWRDGAGAGGSMFEDAAQRAVDGLTGENAADCLAVLASARPVDTYLATQLLAVVARQADDRYSPGQLADRPPLAAFPRVHRPGWRHAYPGPPGCARRRGRPPGALRPRTGPPRRATKARSCSWTARCRPMHRMLLAARGVISRTEAEPYPPGAGSGRGVPTVTACRPGRRDRWRGGRRFLARRDRRRHRRGCAARTLTVQAGTGGSTGPGMTPTGPSPRSRPA